MLVVFPTIEVVLYYFILENWFQSLNILETQKIMKLLITSSCFGEQETPGALFMVRRLQVMFWEKEKLAIFVYAVYEES